MLQFITLYFIASSPKQQSVRMHSCEHLISLLANQHVLFTENDYSQVLVRDGVGIMQTNIR